MTELEDLYMKPFKLLGVPRDERGFHLRGSDPELHYENGEWFHLNTFGPTRPSVPGGSPGIYLSRSKDMLTGYSRKRVLFAPEGDDRGVETFACDYVPPLGKWFGLMTHYKDGKRGSRIVPALADSLGSPWTLYHELSIRPEFEWEQQIGENGVCWSGSYNALVCPYGGKSAPPETQWATGFMASPDFGIHWHKLLTPFAEPPNYFEDGHGINSMAHSTCAEDPHHDYVLHCVTTHGGNVSPDQRGLIHWIYFRGQWRRQPGFLVQPADLGVRNLGGPSLFYHDSQWFMAVYVEDKKRDPLLRRHTRILVEDETTD